jgi:hypothetical protein
LLFGFSTRNEPPACGKGEKEKSSPQGLARRRRLVTIITETASKQKSADFSFTKSPCKFDGFYLRKSDDL